MRTSRDELRDRLALVELEQELRARELALALAGDGGSASCPRCKRLPYDPGAVGRDAGPEGGA